MNLLKRYFIKRREDLRIDNFRFWSKMLERRRNNLNKLVETSAQGQMDNRVEAFIEQARVSKVRALEVIKKYELDLDAEQLNRLEGIEIRSMEDVDVFISYLLDIRENLEKNHKSIPVNSRFLFFPITIGETMLLLVLFIFFTIVF